jgi:hypothetical protein
VSTQPVTLDMSTAQPISAPAPVKLDMSTAQPIDQAAAPGAASRFGTSLASGAGVMSKEDTKNFFLHPIDTLKKSFEAQGQLGEQAKQDFENKDYVRGITHAVEYMMPFVGPNLAQAGKQLEQGDIAGGVGRTVGAAVPMVVPEAAGARVRVPTGALPERMYQSALKPSLTNSPDAIQSMVKTGLGKEIPVSEAGAEKLTGLINDLNAKIKAQVASDPTATVNKFAVASRLSDTAKRFQNQVNPTADLNAISESGNEFLEHQPNQIPAVDAQSLKQGTYQQLKGKAYGELKGATIEAQKALARGIKEELNQQFPELASLNAQDSKFYGLDAALERAVQRQGNHQLIGLGTPAAAAAGGVVTGSGIGAAAAAMLKAAIDDPIVKSRLAIILNKAGKGTSISQATSRVAAYSSALAAASQPHDDQTNAR